MNTAHPNVTTPQSDFVLFSFGADVKLVAEAEIREIFPHIPPFLWLESDPGEEAGVALAALPVNFEACVSRLDRTRPIFLRHLSPVQRTVALTGGEQDIASLQHAVGELSAQVDPAQTISVQTRLLGDTVSREYTRTHLNRALFEEVTQRTGAMLDARAPEQVVSVCCTADTAFIGASLTRQNRSPWPGGERRFKREEGQISRSEFKLLEALEVFGSELPPTGIALDIGAAPGGWTRVLRQKNLRVIAVDPADLDERLLTDSGVEYIHHAIQYYRPTGSFDVMVNDLTMDARDSVIAMLALRSSLKPGGIGIITLKLPRHEVSGQTLLKFVRTDINRLASGFTVVGARHLFHNRSEITVALTTLP
ncbi:MAG: 50S rRNA methyltransferase [Fibrella sp.]|nr:50S rRNA methyltransferase [Armatimonadota bacterium]